MAEGHKTQALQDLQNALRDNETKLLFQRSNTSLYTPNTDDIEKCTFKFLDCFLMEMNVLLHEEDPTNENKYKMLIETTLEVYNIHRCSERYPCELQELAPSNKFLEKMIEFLEKQRALCSQPSTITCD